MALSRGMPPRPQAFVAQTDTQPFAALLDAAVSPAPDRDAGMPAGSAQPDQKKPAAETGAGAQDGAAVAASGPPQGNAVQGPAAPDDGVRGQSGNAGPAQGPAADDAHDRKPLVAPDVKGSANAAPASAANGTPIETAIPGWARHPTAKNGDRRPALGSHTSGPAITLSRPLAVRSAGANPNASTGTNAKAASSETAPSANDAASSDADDSEGKSASSNAAVVAGAAAVADSGGATSANVGTPVASKPSGDGKADQNGLKNAAADATTALPVTSPAQLASPGIGQLAAIPMACDAAPNPAPPAAAKPGLAIAEAVKARAKVMMASAGTEQAGPAQNDSADAADSSSTLDSGDPNASSASAGSNDATGDAAAMNAQLASDQPQAPGAMGAGLFNQLDFGSVGGTGRLSLHGETTAPLNNAMAAMAPNAAPNAAMAPTIGIFGPSALTTNMTARAAAAPDAAVSVAGLAVAIVGRAQAGTSHFDIRLDPPELGRIDVRLDLDGSGQVRTHVTVDRADTLQLLQSQQPQLERALEQAGLKTADNGLQFTLRDQSFAGQNGGTGGQHYPTQSATPLVLPDSDAAPIDTAQIYARLRLGNGLDISV